MALDYQDVNVEVVESTIYTEITEEVLEVDISEADIYVEISEEPITVDVSSGEDIQADIGSDDIYIEVESWSPPQTIYAGGGGYIFITDVTTSGITGNKVFEPDTVPPNSVLNEITIDGSECVVHFIAEGGDKYSPVIVSDNITCTNLQEVVGDKRLFRGSITVSVSDNTTITLTSSTGKSCSVLIKKAAAPPVIESCIIGNYPASQTAAKQGDIIQITGLVDLTATEVKVVAYGGFAESSWVSCSGGAYTINATVNNQNGIQFAQIKVRNLLGSESAVFTSSNSIILDQVSPSFSFQSITCPLGQTAFKNNEVGYLNLLINDFDTVIYDSPNSDFIFDFVTQYTASKMITCTNPNHYNDSTINISVIASKHSNGTTATYQRVIEVADIAPQVTVTQSSSRLRSSPSGYTGVIYANSNQHLLTTPALTIPVSGTWLGTQFAGGTKAYTRSISIKDSDTKGSGAWAFSGSTPTNRAGIPATITGNQTVGGFAPRVLNLQAFSNITTLTTAVINTSKLVFNWSFKSGMLFKSIGTLPPVVQGWTISETGNNTTQIIILDISATAASSQDSQITIEEQI